MKRLLLLLFLSSMVSGSLMSLKVDHKILSKSREIVKLAGTTKKKMVLIKALIAVESSGNTLARGGEDSWGSLQITKICIDDVNRILGKRVYSHKDAFNRDKAIEIFCIYQNYYNSTWDTQKAARIWNGGPNGHHKTSTLAYWGKVKSKIKTFQRDYQVNLV